MTEESNKTCGVVMPISAIDNCSELHWAEVLEIISSAVEMAGFEANLVSNADEVGIIHKRIIQNLYENPIIVCDVSAKNPNVMFELGMRLAFDKPTIIIKDDKTTYSFDTSAIEHLEYPRDLRFSQVVEFKEKLATKLKATYEKSISDKEYTTFLKHFGEFKVAKIDKKEVTGQEYILEELKLIRHELRGLDRGAASSQLFNSIDSYVIYEHQVPKGLARSKTFKVILEEHKGVTHIKFSPGSSDNMATLRIFHKGKKEDLDELKRKISHFIVDQTNPNAD